MDSALLKYPQNHAAQFKKAIALKERRKYKDAILELNDLRKKTSEYKIVGKYRKLNVPDKEEQKQWILSLEDKLNK